MTEPEGKVDVVTIGSRLPEDTEAAMDKVMTNAESTEDDEGNEFGEATKNGEGKKDNQKNDGRRQECVEVQEERRNKYVGMAEYGKEDIEEKTHIKQGKKDGAGEMGEGNDVRREVTVEENDEREKEDDVEKRNALDGGKYDEGDEAGKENVSRREDSVEGEERKREVVDVVGAVKEEEIAREGGEQDAEEVGAENSVTEEEDNKDAEEIGEENNLTEEDESEGGEEKTDESIEANMLKKKRAYGEEAGEKGNEKVVKPRGSKGQESPRMLATSAVQRPLRERKSGKRLVEVIDKEQYRKFVIAKGRGIPLRDIGNVSYKLERKKPDDLKLLHEILFGRRSKAVNFKIHILQFSGFSCNENDDKQRGKVRRRLENTLKDKLLDICDLFDIPVPKSTTRKEDIVVKLLEFMEAPHAASDAIIAEKDESSQSRKQKRMFEETTSKNMSGMLAKGPGKKRVRCEPTTAQMTKISEETNEDNEEDNSRDIESGRPVEDKSYALSDSDGSENRAEETYEQENGHLKNGSSTVRTLLKTPSLKHHSRKKINVDSTTKKSSSIRDKKQRSTGKGKTGFGPNKEELRKWIREILNKVDFNTATINDIFEQLNAYYKMDHTPKQSTIKWMIQKELNKLARKTVENDEPDEGTTFKNVGRMIAKGSRKDDGNNVGVKTLSKRKKNVDAPKQKSTELTIAEAKLGRGPSWEEMRKMTREILKRIDLRTGTVKDIVIELGSYFKMDLTPEKSAIKVMIVEELTRLAEESVENEDGEDELVEGTTSKIFGRKVVKGPRKKRYMRELTATKRKGTEEAEDNKKETDEDMKNGQRDLSRSSKHQSEERKDFQEKFFSRRKKKVDAPEETSSSKPDRMERSSGKKPSTSKGAEASGPSNKELKMTICDILQAVDFNTTTFGDVVKQITDSYQMDLTLKMETIKSIIENELRRLKVDAETEQVAAKSSAQKLKKV